MAAAKDLTGQRFGKLTVLELDPQPYISPGGKPTRRWRCRCDCGHEIVAIRKNLLSGDVRSCGCLLAESSASRVAKDVGQVDGTTLSAIRPERKANSNSKSGIKGVYWSTREGCWIAKITVQRRCITLGRFHSLEDARKARLAGEELYFSPILATNSKT